MKAEETSTQKVIREAKETLVALLEGLKKEQSAVMKSVIERIDSERAAALREGLDKN